MKATGEPLRALYDLDHALKQPGSHDLINREQKATLAKVWCITRLRFTDNRLFSTVGATTSRSLDERVWTLRRQYCIA